MSSRSDDSEYQQLAADIGRIKWLEQRVDRLEAALAPFAGAARNMPGWICTVNDISRANFDSGISWLDLKRAMEAYDARAALTQGEPHAS